MPVNCANLPNSLCNILAFFTVSSSDLSGQKTAHLRARHQALTLGIDSLVWVSFNIITTRRTSPHSRANRPVLTFNLHAVYANSLLAVYVFFCQEFRSLEASWAYPLSHSLNSRELRGMEFFVSENQSITLTGPQFEDPANLWNAPKVLLLPSRSSLGMTNCRCVSRLEVQGRSRKSSTS